MRALLIIILIGLFSLLWVELFYFKPGEQPSALINQPVPAFELTDLLHAPQILDEKKLIGQVSLLNIWATWCDACLLEHAMLMKIKQDYHVPIYSINYKDDPQKVIAWLKAKGNPYQAIGLDQTGRAAIDFGIYGTPETFIINAQGKIVYRHIGVLNKQVWESILYPIIKRIDS
jgi:cytochrome c biogenesis protein CcmG/thiol:disulfide interchange protein DsbE